jgi:hypothetical protein
VVEVPAESDGEDQAPEGGVLDRGHQRRASALVGPGEQGATEQGQQGCDPVLEHDVNGGEGQRATQNPGHATGEDPSVTVKNEGTINDALRVDREDGIQHHHQRPKPRARADDAEQSVGGVEHRQQDQQGDRGDDG